MQQIGVIKQNEFLVKKQLAARYDQTLKAQSFQNQIGNYEDEANYLEKMEADLLVKLQETQKQERDAFVHLESAMVDASIPKAMRKAPSSQASNYMQESAQVKSGYTNLPVFK